MRFRNALTPTWNFRLAGAEKEIDAGAAKKASSKLMRALNNFIGLAEADGTPAPDVWGRRPW
jgi:hypothetical protein